ncbi:MAG: fimbrillin family protein [Phocaeicola sp.]
MKRYTTLVSLLAVLTSCSTNIPVPEEVPLAQDTLVYLSYGLSTQINPSSRAPIETTYLPNGSKVGVFGLKSRYINGEYVLIENPTKPWAEVNVQKNLLNAPYTASVSTSGGITITTLDPDGIRASYPSCENGALQFYAYYPYTSEIEYDGALVKPTAPCVPVHIEKSLDATIDYLYASKQNFLGGQKKPASLTFHHALSRLNFRLYTENPSFVGDYSPVLQEIEVNTRIAQRGKMSLDNGDILTDETVEDDQFTQTVNYQIDVRHMTDSETDTGGHFFFIPAVRVSQVIKSIVFKVYHPSDGTTSRLKIYDYKTAAKQIELKKGVVTTLNLKYAYPK